MILHLTPQASASLLVFAAGVLASICVLSLTVDSLGRRLATLDAAFRTERARASTAETDREIRLTLLEKGAGNPVLGSGTYQPPRNTCPPPSEWPPGSLYPPWLRPAIPPGPLSAFSVTANANPLPPKSVEMRKEQFSKPAPVVHRWPQSATIGKPPFDLAQEYRGK